MSSLFGSKRSIVTAALTVVSAVTIGCISAFMITAAPKSEVAEAQLIASSDIVRITAPKQTPKTSLPKPESEAPTETNTTGDADEVIIAVSDGLSCTSPSLESDEETELSEVSDETESVLTEHEIENDEYEPEITTTTESIVAASPVTEAVNKPENKTEYDFTIVPEIPEGFLADQLGVEYTVKAPIYDVTEEEIIFAATIVQLEVMGDGSSLYRFENIPQKYFEMLAVAQCIRNRMESSRFPNTASQVMFQSLTTPSGYTIYQFSPREKLEMYSPTYEAVVAAREVLLSGVSVLPNNYFYFCATRICDSFEANNNAVFGRKADGSMDKVEGHLTTFYAGY